MKQNVTRPFLRDAFGFIVTHWSNLVLKLSEDNSDVCFKPFSDLCLDPGEATADGRKLLQHQWHGKSSE